MKGTLTLKNNKRSIIWIGAVVLVTVLSLIVAFLLINRERELDEYRDALIDTLLEKAGEYDERSVVLNNTSPAKARKIANMLGAELRISGDGKFAALTVPEGTTILDVVRNDANREILSDISIDFSARIFDTEEQRDTSEPDYSVSDTLYELQAYLDYINLQAIWASTKGRGVTVAVIDTGLDYDHPEFAGRISEYSYNASSGKIVKDCLLADGSYDYSIIDDPNGHGTAVAGIIAAAMDGEGIVGIAPEIELLVIKAEVDESGSFLRTSDLVFGLYYAIERDVSVVNMSFGTNSEIAFKEATKLAYDSDIICVAAAGNDSSSALTYPAAHEFVIGVGALGEGTWSLAEYSNYGENVDVVAPGTTYTTLTGGNYGYQSGTSMSSPIVASAIALLQSLERYNDFETVKALLYASSYDLGELGSDWYFGYGALDVSALISEPRGSITFDMLTDELDDISTVFIRNHTLQNIPLPERLYSIFDGWYYDPHCTEEYNWYEDKFTKDLTLYAKWTNEDDGLPFTYKIKSDGTVEITSYTGHRRYITVPSYIDGREVSAIGDGAFKLERELRIVSLPDTLTYIGSGAFEACSQLVSIEIPSGVTFIGDYAFADCSRMSSVSIPDSSALTEIGASAFKNCARLLGFKITDKVVSCKEDAFLGCHSLTAFEVSSGNTVYSSPEGTLCNLAKDRLICFPYGKSGIVSLPETVKTVGSYAFRGARCRSVELSGVTKIENLAFFGSYITHIAISDSVTELGDMAFAECYSLLRVELGSGITKIPERCFLKCSVLQSIHIPEAVEYIATQAFFECGALSSVSIADNSRLKAVGSSAFMFCLSLESVDFGENGSLEVIESTAFSYTAITELNIPKSLKTIEGGAFSPSSIAEIDFALPSSVTFIGADAFASNFISELTLPESLTELQAGAFAKNLMESVSVPKSVETLGAAFHSCKNLTNVYIDSENDSYVDINGVVYTATLDTVIQYPAGRATHTYTVESGTSVISAFAFAGTVNLKEAVLPSGLTDIGDRAFSSSQSLISVTVPEGALNIGISAFYASYKLETVKLPQSLLTIGDECFMLCTGLSSIELPDNIQKIGNAAFAYTDSLQSLNIPKSFTVISDGPFNSCGTRIYVLHGGITEISSRAFVNNYNLCSISIPDSVSSIGAHAFKGCWALADISISESTALTRLDMNALGDCGIRSMRIPAKISTMGQGVFRGCRYLTSVIFSEGSLLPSISAYMFDGADALEAITFENGSALSSIQAHGLEGMINLQSIDFGDALLTNIDNFAFRFCQSLESITIPEGVTYIGRYAFYGCSSLGEVALPESLEYIGRFAFLDTDDVTLYFGAEKLPSSLAEDWDYDVTAYFLGVSSVGENESYKYATLKSGDISIIKYLGSDTAIDLNQVELGGKISVIGGGAFAYSPITSVTLPETLTTIQKEAFMGSALTSISIPASVEFIGQNAFANTPITALSFAEGASLRTIEQSAFENTRELRSLTLPASLSTLGRGAFKNSGIRELVFEDGCTLATISDGAFAYTKIASLTIPDSVTLIDNSAFVGVSELRELSFGGGELMIMSNAFYNTGIEELTIPLGVTYIGEFAFTGLKNLTEFKVEQGHPHYKSVSGLLVSSDGKKLITAPAGMTGSFTVPAEIEIIGFGAFEGSLLENVYFSDSSNILTLGHRAFYGAKNLKSIYIPDSVVSIDYYAFAECSSLEAVEFGVDSKLMGIYEGAFYACKSLRSIEIPDAIVEISDFAFYGCTSLNRIPISEGSSLLGIYSYAFAYSGISGDFAPPSTLLDIGEYAFMGTKITSLTIDSNDPWNMAIGLGAFEDCNVLESLHLEFIGEFDGSDNSWLGYIFGAGDYVASPAYIPESLKKITLSENVTTLYDYAFYGVADVEEIVFGQSAITVYSRAFLNSDFDYRFTGEVTTLIKNGKSIAYAYSNHFSDRIHGDLVISDDVELIYLTRPSFTHLNSISIPGSASLISFDYLYNSLPIENVYYRGTLADWCNIEFTGDAIGLFTKNLYIDGERIGESLTVPEGVSTLPNAFDALGIKKLSLPKSLISVDDDFYISTLEEVTVNPENKHFASHGGLLYTKDYKALVLIPSVIGSKVELHEGLLTIPERAFMYQASLKHVVMPSTLKEIGNSAFNSCYSLVEIVLPDGVVKIGDNAFFECTSLMNVTLSASLTEIGTSAFYGDSMLCVINNHSSLALSHGSDDFGGVARNARLIVLPDGTKHYAGGSDGFEYIKTAEGLIFTGKHGSYQLNRYVGEAETVALPESINGSSYEIYYFKGAKTVVLPHGMTSIASYSFCDSETLERVILPETLQSISMWAFYNCTKLDNLVLPASLTEINTLAFDGCTSLNTVYLPDTMSEIQDYWFISSPLGNVVISDTHPTLVSFGNMVCTKDMKEIVFVSPNVKNIIIPKEIEDIGTALANSGIQSVRFEAGSRVKEITTMAFQNCGYLEYVEIPHGVTKLWHDAFQNCRALSEIILPPSVREIGESCFIGCSSLKSINIPSNMTVVPNNVFSGCSSLEAITLPERVTEIGKGAFFGCSSLKSVNIGQNVTKIGEKAFFGCSSLKGEVIGKNLTEIGNAAFAGCAYDAVSLGSGVTQFTVRDGVIYNTDFTRIIAICEQINNVTIPSTVGDIGEFFRENKYIESVVFEDGCAITEIPANAFTNCTNLKSVKLHDGVERIGMSAFFGCTSLTDINFPNGLTRIDISAFFSSKLTSLDLPKTLLKIGENAFSHTSVKKVVFGGTTVVDSGAFDLCEIYVVVSEGNMKLTLGDRLTNGGVAANALCIVTKNGEYVYAEDVYHEGDFLFKKTNGSYLLKAYMGEGDTVTLPLTVNGEKYSIYKFHGIKNIVIPEGITEISYSAFEGGDVETVSVPSTVTSIGERAFLNCRKLVSVRLAEAHPTLSIGASAFYGCTSLAAIDLSSVGSMPTLDSMAFAHCTALSGIRLPEKIGYLGGEVLINTAYYENEENWEQDTLYVSKHLIRVRENAVYHLYKDGTGAIAIDCFEGCYKLKRATVGGARLGVLKSLTNVETVIITEMPRNFNFSWYFAEAYYSNGNLPATLKNLVLLDTSYMTSTYENDLVYEKPDSFFACVSGITVFVGETKKTLGWDENFYKWNGDNRVYYSDKWIIATFLNPDSSIKAESPILTHQIVRVPWTDNYYDESYYYVFLGYDIDGDGTVDTVPATSSLDITASPVYQAANRCDYGIHFNVWTEGVAADCGKNGIIPHYHCESCGVNTSADGELLESVVIESTGHVYFDVVYKPTCTEEGYTEHICSCLHSYKDSYTEKVPHSYEHSTVAPTCSAEGYTLHSCIWCTDSYTDSYVAKTDHIFSAWGSIGNVCTDVGEMRRDCIFCDAYESTPTGPLGHDIIYHEGKDSTTTAAGYKDYETCTRCDYTTYEEIPIKADKAKFISVIKRLSFLTDSEDRFKAIRTALEQYHRFTDEEKQDSEVQEYYAQLLLAIEEYNAIAQRANGDYLEACEAILSAFAPQHIIASAAIAILFLIKKYLSVK